MILCRSLFYCTVVAFHLLSLLEIGGRATETLFRSDYHFPALYDLLLLRNNVIVYVYQALLRSPTFFSNLALGH